MKKNHHTADQLKEMAPDYFTSNPDVDYLVASTHDGVFYRPENAGYALAGAQANDGELVKVTRTAEATTVTSQALNVNLNRLLTEHGHVADDLPAFLAHHLNRVANGEEPGLVLVDMLAGVLPTSTTEQPADEQPADDKPAGDKPAGDKPAGDKPAGDASTKSTAPASTTTARKPRAAAAPKAAAPKKAAAAKSPKTKASTKAAE
jgi:hypothetical protein